MTLLLTGLLTLNAWHAGPTGPNTIAPPSALAAAQAASR